MNAPARTIETAGHFTGFEPTLEHLPLDCMIVSCTHVQNLRRKRYDSAGLLELAASIKSIGVAQAIVVRPFTGRNITHNSTGLAPKYEIVAGERRWLAADRAGLGHIPAVVRELTDEQVLEIQLVENLQREGLHPLEEGAGYKELMELKHIDAEAVGAMVGKSRSYVYSRTKLLDLCPAAREALQAGTLDASKALLLARITNEKDQEKALKAALETNWRGEAISYKAFFDTLRDKHTIALAGAPFALDDATLFRFEKIIGRRGQEESIQLPACTACPQFSGNDPELADGLPPGTHVCTGADCYAAKVKEIGRRRRSDAEKAGQTILAGEDAKKIAPRKDKLVGFVDLDEACDFDPYPEAAPKPTVSEDEESPTYIARLDAWETLEQNWTGRSYRVLLQGQLDKLDITRIEDPKTKLIRELVRLKDARALLAQQHEIKLPGYVGAPEPKRSNPHDYKADAEKHAKLQREREVREAAEIEFRRAVLAAIAVKCNGPLKRDELVDIADTLSNHTTLRVFKEVFGKALEPGDAKESDLPRIIRLALIASCCGWAGQHPGPLLAAAKRWKVDTAKIKKDLAAKAKGGTEDKAAAAKPAAKKKAAKK